jgi:hypothetical protein
MPKDMPDVTHAHAATHVHGIGGTSRRETYPAKGCTALSPQLATPATVLPVWVPSNRAMHRDSSEYQNPAPRPNPLAVSHPFVLHQIGPITEPPKPNTPTQASPDWCLSRETCQTDRGLLSLRARVQLSCSYTPAPSGRPFAHPFVYTWHAFAGFLTINHVCLSSRARVVWLRSCGSRETWGWRSEPVLRRAPRKPSTCTCLGTL